MLIQLKEAKNPYNLSFIFININERIVAAYSFRSIKVPTYAETHGKAED